MTRFTEPEVRARFRVPMVGVMTSCTAAAPKGTGVAQWMTESPPEAAASRAWRRGQ